MAMTTRACSRKPDCGKSRKARQKFNKNSPLPLLITNAILPAALIANIVSVIPLLPYLAGDANMRATWLFSRNDAIGNVAVLMAKSFLALTSSSWPDLIVALLTASLFLHSAWHIIRHAVIDLNEVKATEEA